MTEYEPTYWNNKGKYEEEYRRLWKKLVPPEGKAETTDGELLRCISRFYYEYFNNGCCNDTTYWTEYVNSYRWDAGLDINIHDDMAPEELDKAMDKVIEYLLSKGY